MVHFIPQPKLPSGKEMAEAMLLHVLCLHSLPRDVVSEQWPQFWKTFCATMSLTFGYPSSPMVRLNG